MLISYCDSNQTLLITAQRALGMIETLSGTTGNLKPLLTEAFHSKTQTLLVCDNSDRSNDRSSYKLSISLGGGGSVAALLF